MRQPPDPIAQGRQETVLVHPVAERAGVLTGHWLVLLVLALAVAFFPPLGLLIGPLLIAFGAMSLRRGYARRTLAKALLVAGTLLTIVGGLAMLAITPVQVVTETSVRQVPSTELVRP